MPRYLFIFLIACSAFAACSNLNDGEKASEVAQGRDDTCGTAHYEATRLHLELEYGNALERLRDVLILCRDAKSTLYDALFRVADIARLSPEQCKTAQDLYSLVEPSNDIDFLRASANLFHVCAEPSSSTAHFSRLVEALAKEMYGSNAEETKAFVWHTERANLYHWTGSNEDLVQSLRDATQALCKSDSVLSLVVEAIGRSTIGRSNPGSILGFWLSQPEASIDDESRRCLARVAEEVQEQLSGFPPDIAEGSEQWLLWFGEPAPDGSVP